MTRKQKMIVKKRAAVVFWFTANIDPILLSVLLFLLLLLFLENDCEEKGSDTLLTCG